MDTQTADMADEMTIRAEALARQALSEMNSFLPKNQPTRNVDIVKGAILTFYKERMQAILEQMGKGEA